METKKFKDLVLRNREAIMAALRASIDPVFDENSPEKYEHIFVRYAKLQRGLVPMQAIKAAAIETYLDTGNKACIASLDTGYGKTTVASAIASRGDFKTIVVVSPPHLTKKWEREIREVLGDGDYDIVHVQAWRDMLPLTKKGEPTKRKTFFIVSKTIGSMGLRMEKYFLRRRRKKKVRKKVFCYDASLRKHVDRFKKVSIPIEQLVCPDCGKPFRDYRLDDGRVAPKNPQSIPTACPFCGSALMRPKRNKVGKIPKRISPAELVGRYAKKGAIDLLIVDEIHEEKAKNTARAEAFGQLVGKSRKVIGLTGTLLGGYASHAFYTLFRLFPKVFTEELGLRWSDVSTFVERYGGTEELWELGSYDPATGKATKGDRCHGKRERPELSPKLLDALLPAVVFGRLDELKFRDEQKALPPYEEHSHKVAIEPEIQEAYGAYLKELVTAARVESEWGDSKTVFAELQRTALLIPDMPYKARSGRYPAYNKKKGYDPVGKIIKYKPPVIREEKDRTDSSQIVLPMTKKERQLVKRVDAAIKRGRRVIVCYDFVSEGLGEELAGVLHKHSKAKRIAHLTAKVKASERETWIKESDVQVLLANPELIKTGLDLLEFPTIVFYDQAYATYNVFTLRQAAKRAWRIGQTERCEVHSIAYAGTYQAKALELVGGKMNVSQGIEGRLSSGRDIAGEGDDENMQIEMAKAIMAAEIVDNATASTVGKVDLQSRPWTPMERYFIDLMDEVRGVESQSVAMDALELPETVTIERVVHVGRKKEIVKETIKRDMLESYAKEVGSPIYPTLF